MGRFAVDCGRGNRRPCLASASARREDLHQRWWFTSDRRRGVGRWWQHVHGSDVEWHGVDEVRMMRKLIAVGMAAILTLAGVDAVAQEAKSPFEERFVALDREAIDLAYRNQVERLFSTWLKDPAGQPARALSGIRNARRAYTGAMQEIEKREGLRTK